MMYNRRFEDLGPEHILRTEPALMNVLGKINNYCGGKLWIHRLQDPSAGTTSQHFHGTAADGHIDGMSVLDQYVLLERWNPGGLGLYGPDVWRHPGFHFDFRPGGPPTAKWGCVLDKDKKQAYVALDRTFFVRIIGLENGRETSG